MSFMSQSELSVSKQKIPKLAVLVLAAVFALGIFIVAFENGHIANLVYAEDVLAGGIDPMILHELTHDMRHAAGFPCH